MKFLLRLFFLLILTSCGSIATKEDVAEIKKNDEFDKILTVKKYSEKDAGTPQIIKDNESEKKNDLKTKIKIKKKLKVMGKKITEKNEPKKIKSSKTDDLVDEAFYGVEGEHFPHLEDSEGFVLRRPIVDPFVPGEETVMSLKFGIVSAGELKLRINPFVEVNGEKAYAFSVHVKSNSVFSLFYKVDDWAETFVRYDDLLPLSYALHVKESKQLKESRSFFDWEKNEMRFWEKKIRDDEKKEVKKIFPLEPYSQSILSAFFYLRTFTYAVGKTLEFRVADDGKPLTVQIEVFKKEKIEIGGKEMDTFVGKVNFEHDGVFKQKGDILLWIEDSPRKRVLKIDAKIKIGSLIIEAQK